MPGASLPPTTLLPLSATSTAPDASSRASAISPLCAETQRDAIETLGSAGSVPFVTGTAGTNSLPIATGESSARRPADPRPPSASLIERIAALVDLAAHPPLLGAETLSLIADSDAVVHAAIVETRPDGTRVTVTALSASGPRPRSTHTRTRCASCWAVIAIASTRFGQFHETQPPLAPRCSRWNGWSMPHSPSRARGIRSASRPPCGPSTRPNNSSAWCARARRCSTSSRRSGASRPRTSPC